MITYIIVCIIAILFAVTESIGLCKRGLFLGFIFTTVLYALHYDFGNDYMSYYDWFTETLNTDLISNFQEFLDLSRDPGWSIINYIFGLFFGEYGFFVLVAVIGILQSWAYYTLIRTYVSKQWYWLSMTIYVFTPSLFLQSFNIMRLSVVMCIFALLIPLLQQKKIILPLLVMLFCYFIHGSCIILIPVIFLSLIPFKPRTLAITSLALLIMCFVLRNSFVNFFINFSEFRLGSRFAHYLEDAEHNTFRLGYIFGLIPFFVAIVKLLNNEIDSKYHWIFCIWLIGIILAPLSGITTIIERLTFYFSQVSIVVLPIIYSQIKNPIFRITFICIWGVLAIWGVRSYMMPTSIFYEPYKNYQTIFSVL